MTELEKALDTPCMKCDCRPKLSMSHDRPQFACRCTTIRAVDMDHLMAVWELYRQDWCLTQDARAERDADAMDMSAPHSVIVL